MDVRQTAHDIIKALDEPGASRLLVIAEAMRDIYRAGAEAGAKAWLSEPRREDRDEDRDDAVLRELQAELDELAGPSTTPPASPAVRRGRGADAPLPPTSEQALVGPDGLLINAEAERKVELLERRAAEGRDVPGVPVGRSRRSQREVEAGAQRAVDAYWRRFGTRDDPRDPQVEREIRAHNRRVAAPVIPEEILFRGIPLAFERDLEAVKLIEDEHEEAAAE